ncbi:hypothetical protein BKK47_07250 [Rodentibacter mrazii]|uniref:TraX protein n=1 Tax=Rodentibacter mrazii TaxID=1908257 RepID=A0A1V3IES0_9PAST|nr:TraX family protein [Rodentibacter mrazii]OOF39160.1 hypothetical protein BKK47_07250 [Rodentibacter mrazii]
MPYLTSSQTEWLKWLALITMVIDHVGIVFQQIDPIFLVFRGIGRFSYLAFGFIIALNLSRDNVNLSAYLQWMFITALLSEFCFKAFQPNYDRLNVLFQFFAVVGVIWVYQHRYTFHYLLQGMLYAIFLFISYHADYSLCGLLYCVTCYFFFQLKPGRYKSLTMIGCVLMGFFVNHRMLEDLWGTVLWSFIVLSITFTLFYLFYPQGIRRSAIKIRRMKKIVFYAFYPLHLLIIMTIKHFFIG